jgi:hypothetical protein
MEMNTSKQCTGLRMIQSDDRPPLLGALSLIVEVHIGEMQNSGGNVTFRTFRTSAAAALYRNPLNNCSANGANRWTRCHSEALCSRWKLALNVFETPLPRRYTNASWCQHIDPTLIVMLLYLGLVLPMARSLRIGYVVSGAYMYVLFSSVTCNLHVCTRVENGIRSVSIVCWNSTTFCTSGSSLM